MSSQNSMELPSEVRRMYQRCIGERTILRTHPSGPTPALPIEDPPQPSLKGGREGRGGRISLRFKVISHAKNAKSAEFTCPITLALEKSQATLRQESAEEREAKGEVRIANCEGRRSNCELRSSKIELR